VFAGSIGIARQELDGARPIFPCPVALGILRKRAPTPPSAAVRRLHCPPILIDLIQLCGMACFWPLISPMISRAGAPARPGLLLQVEKLE
jgi:hypothetical protein